MKLTLKRHTFTDKSTIGSLQCGAIKICDTLEDADRKLEKAGETAKVYGKTAIPRGTYKLTIDWSNRFTKYMILVNDVPYFKGVRIHAGNTPADTDGCILCGDRYEEDSIINSRIKTNRVFLLVESELKLGKEVWLEIV